jgi:hypothetical protein
MITTEKIISAGFSILFNYMLYTYLDKLDKIGCGCSGSMVRNSIKTSILLNYIITFGLLVFGTSPISTSILITIYNVSSAISIFSYLGHLKKTAIKCSEDIKREVYYYYYLLTVILQFVLISMYILLVLSSI